MKLQTLRMTLTRAESTTQEQLGRIIKLEEEKTRLQSSLVEVDEDREAARNELQQQLKIMGEWARDKLNAETVLTEAEGMIQEYEQQLDKLQGAKGDLQSRADAVPWLLEAFRAARTKAVQEGMAQYQAEVRTAQIQLTECKAESERQALIAAKLRSRNQELVGFLALARNDAQHHKDKAHEVDLERSRWKQEVGDLRAIVLEYFSREAERGEEARALAAESREDMYEVHRRIRGRVDSDSQIPPESSRPTKRSKKR